MDSNIDPSIVVALEQFGALRPAHISWLVKGKGKPRKSVGNRVRWLHDAGQIECLAYGGDRVYFLPQEREVTVPWNSQVEDLRNVMALPKEFFREWLPVIDFQVRLFCDLQVSSPVVLHRFVRGFERKGFHPSPVRSEKKLRFVLETELSDVPILVEPMAMFVLRSRGGGNRYQRLCFLEFDLKKSLSDLVQLVVGYVRLMRSGQFRKFGQFSRFTVFLVAASHARLAKIRTVLSEIKGAEVILMCAFPDIRSGSLLFDPIWWDCQGQCRQLLQRE